MFYIFGKDADEKNKGRPPFWYTNNGKTYLGGTSAPIVSSSPYGLVWPGLQASGQNNCGEIEFTYSFIRDGTIGRDNDIMSAVNYGGHWTVVDDIEGEAYLFETANKRLCVNEIIANVSGAGWPPSVSGGPGYPPGTKFQNHGMNLYTTGGEFIAFCSGAGTSGANNIGYKFAASFVDQKYGMVLLAQRGPTSNWGTGIAQLFTTGGELLQTYLPIKDTCGRLPVEWPSSVAILDSGHIAIGAPDFLTGVDCSLPPQDGARRAKSGMGVVQIYRTGETGHVAMFSGHDTSEDPQYGMPRKPWFGAQIASTKSGICIGSAGSLYADPYTAMSPSYALEFRDLSGNYVSEFLWPSWSGGLSDYTFRGSSVPIAANDYNFYVVGGCTSSSVCNIGAFIFDSSGVRQGEIPRVYGVPPSPEGDLGLQMIDASNANVVHSTILEGVLRSLTTGGAFKEENRSKPFLDVGTNGEIIASRYSQAPFYNTSIPPSCSPISPALAHLPCTSGLAIYRPTGEVTFDQFTGQVGEAFDEWSGLFRSIFTGLSLKFTNLGLEPNANIPSSPTAPDYPITNQVGDLRIGMQHIDHKGGIAAYAFLPGGLRGISGNAGGDIHLDSQDAWRLDTSPASDIPSSVSIKYVVAHEIGHALGIGHDSDNKSLMYPSITNTTSFKGKFPNGLSGSAADQVGALSLYGPITRPPWTPCP